MSEISPPPTPKKEVIAPHRESPSAEFADEPLSVELNYGEARLWLVARDPHSLFAYWEFRPGEHPDAVGEDGRARFFLRIFHEGGKAGSSTGIEAGAGNAFILADAPDSGYFAELGFYAGVIWCFLARTGITRTPPELPSAEARPIFATIPAQLSLGKMRDLVADSALPGESPAVTAARIQSDARQHGEWTPRHERLLAEILGVSASAPPESPVIFPALTQAVRQKLAATAAAATPGTPIPASQIESAPAPLGASWPTSK
ncbi:MAG: DUF4912 domain-containing protein [Chthoniobacteraceae bacterium]